MKEKTKCSAQAFCGSSGHMVISKAYARPGKSFSLFSRNKTHPATQLQPQTQKSPFSLQKLSLSIHSICQANTSLDPNWRRTSLVRACPPLLGKRICNTSLKFIYFHFSFHGNIGKYIVLFFSKSS